MGYFKYKSTLDDVVNSSELVIGHAGAGTILQALRSNKKLIVVINERLMNNHQKELGDACSNKQYCLSTVCNNLLSTIQDLPNCNFKEYPKPNIDKLKDFINEEMGVI